MTRAGEDSDPVLVMRGITKRSDKKDDGQP